MIRENRWKYTDNLRRKLFIKNEIKKILLKSIIKNTNLPLVYRYFALYNKSKLIRFSLISQQKNKCVETGRVWTTVKNVNYSRFYFRTESNCGNLPGFRRASW
jgi:small subunit ribosomal protein S14